MGFFQFGLFAPTVLSGIDPSQTLITTLGLNVVIKFVPLLPYDLANNDRDQSLLHARDYHRRVRGGLLGTQVDADFGTHRSGDRWIYHEWCL